MPYKIDDIEGITGAGRSQMNKAGITKTSASLRHCGSAKLPRQVAASSERQVARRIDQAKSMAR